MTRALARLLQKYHGKDVMAYREGPWGLYLWDIDKGEHIRYDPFYRPPSPTRRDYPDARTYKRALDQRSLFLSRRKQAARDSF